MVGNHRVEELSLMAYEGGPRDPTGMTQKWKGDQAQEADSSHSVWGRTSVMSLKLCPRKPEYHAMSHLSSGPVLGCCR